MSRQSFTVTLTYSSGHENVKKTTSKKLKTHGANLENLDVCSQHIFEEMQQDTWKELCRFVKEQLK